MANRLANPKLDDDPGSNTEKAPDNWVSGDDPMTGAQASYLTTLSEEAGQAPPPDRRPKRRSRSHSAGWRGVVPGETTHCAG